MNMEMKHSRESGCLMALISDLPEKHFIDFYFSFFLHCVFESDWSMCVCFLQTINNHWQLTTLHSWHHAPNSIADLSWKCFIVLERGHSSWCLCTQWGELSQHLRHQAHARVISVVEYILWYYLFSSLKLSCKPNVFPQRSCTLCFLMCVLLFKRFNSRKLQTKAVKKSFTMYQRYRDYSKM